MRQHALAIGAFLISLWSPVGAATALPLQSGDILVATGSGIVQLDPLTGAHSVFSSFVGQDIDWGGGSIAAISGNTVVKIDPVTGAATIISSGGLLNQAATAFFSGGGRIAVGPTGDIFVPIRLGLAFNGNGLIKIDPKTGAQTVVVAEGLNGETNDLSVRPDGKIVVVSERGDIETVDPLTGAITGGGGDHLHGIDIATDGLVVLQLRGPEFSVVSAGGAFTNFNNLFASSQDFDDAGIIDMTWGLYDHLLFSTNLGVFEVDTLGPTSPYTYAAITHDVHGRLTVFIPSPATLLLLGSGLAGLAGISAWSSRRSY